MRIRTFIAVPAAPSIRGAAEKLIRRLRAVTSDVKWVAPENLHWTLHFLGEVDEQEILELSQAMAAAVQQIEAFDLHARGAGAFPSPDRPRTLWLGAGEGGEGLAALHAAIGNQLQRLGYRTEQRRFVPHITIGRAGRNERSQSLVRELAELADYDGSTMLVDEVIIFGSQLTPTGPVYEELAYAPLG